LDTCLDETISTFDCQPSAAATKKKRHPDKVGMASAWHNLDIALF